MQDINNNLLRDNISKLMNSAKISQNALGKNIGMSQSNFSRAMSYNSKQCFTLAQIYKIAQYFNVSIDSLVGNTKSGKKSSEKEICQILTSLIEQRTLVRIDFERPEEVITPVVNYKGIPETETSTENTKYNAFIFPNFYDPGPLDRFTEDQLEDFRSDVYYGGNHDNSNKRINSFFDKYFQIYDMYTHNQITEEFFHEIVDKFLEDLQ